MVLEDVFSMWQEDQNVIQTKRSSHDNNNNNYTPSTYRQYVPASSLENCSIVRFICEEMNTTLCFGGQGLLMK